MFVHLTWGVCGLQPSATAIGARPSLISADDKSDTGNNSHSAPELWAGLALSPPAMARSV